MGDRTEGELGGAVELLALLAVVVAVAHAVGPQRERRLRARLELIAEDWARTEAPAALQGVSRGFLKPAAAMLDAPAPRPVKRGAL